MNNRLIKIIAEYFNTFMDDYIISVNGNKNASYMVIHNRVVYKINEGECTTIKASEIIAVSTTAARLTIKTILGEEHYFIARPKTKEEKINELIHIIKNILSGRKELNMIERYLDKLEEVSKA